ncbi:chloride channel protein [Bordetella bronchialis]|nr:chloride channel protein [Bordetella bronchialis]
MQARFLDKVDKEGRTVPDYLRGIVLAVAMGILGALAAHVFRWALEHASARLFGTDADITEVFAGLPWYARIAFPTIGGAIAALLLARAQRQEKQQGVVSEYLETIDGRMARIPVLPSVLRCVSSFFSIVSGGSIGKEGAMVQLSATAGSVFCARLLPAVRGADFRLAVAMAATGGLTAVYHTPLAAAVFVAEIAFGSLELRRIGYLFTAAVASTWITSVIGQFNPLYDLPAYAFDVTGKSVLAVVALGLAAGVVGSAFLWSTRLARKWFATAFSSLVLRMSVGGLIVGVITLAAPDVTGNGFAPVARLLEGSPLVTPLFLLLLLKVLATAATVGSGAIGGLFTPSLLIGALTGVACAPLAAQAFGLQDAAVLFGVLGMAASLAATTQAPLMSTLMVFEMTSEPSFVFPLMIATVAAYAVSMLFRLTGTYEVIARHRARDERRSLLADATAAAVMRPIGLLAPLSATLQDALQVGLKQRNRFVFLVDDAQRFVGAVWVNDLMARVNAGEGADTTLARMATTDFPVVYADQRLLDVWQTVVESPAERTPVLSDRDGRRVVGMLQKSELLKQARQLFA